MGKRRSSNRIFAKRLRQLRHEADLTQEGFAYQSGLHYNYIGGIERCQRNITLNTADRIARALGVSILDMLSDD